MRDTGWDIDIAAHVRRGGHVLGICGGYQMLGRTVADPEGIEGPPRTVPASDFSTSRRRSAATRSWRRSAANASPTATPFTGYEMHVGRTSGAGLRSTRCCASPTAAATARPSPDGRVLGGYVHGLFADDRQRAAWLEKLGGDASALNYEADVDATLDALAGHLERHLDCNAILALAAVPSFTA